MRARHNLGPIEALAAIAFLVVVAWVRGQDSVPDLRERDPQGELRGRTGERWEVKPYQPAPTAPLTPRDAHKIVAPMPRPTPTPTPPPGLNALERVGERVRFLSSIEVGPWAGARWRGKGTGASDGGAAISATTPSGLKPTIIIGPRVLGAALGVSRVFIGGEVASGKVFAVVGFEPLVW